MAVTDGHNALNLVRVEALSRNELRPNDNLLDKGCKIMGQLH